MGVALAVLTALAQSRIYQSTVTVAISESAKDDGWDELSVSDLCGWLPMITQQVARQFTRRYNAEPLLGIKMKDREADWLVVEPKIRSHLKAVVQPAASTLVVSYRHQDFKVAVDVVDAFGHAYEAYPLSRERENPEAMSRRMGKIKNYKMGLQSSPVRVVASGWAASGDYLRRPIISHAVWGSLVAVVCGVVMVVVTRLALLLVGGRS